MKKFRKKTKSGFEVEFLSVRMKLNICTIILLKYGDWPSPLRELTISASSNATFSDFTRIVILVDPVTRRKYDCVILSHKVCIWYAARQCTFRTHKSLKSQNHNGSSKHNVYRPLPSTQI
ncbi:hypothetical protein V1477_020279 [Vespula maculifrons]|uniref:Uncharacterized protein n=1 Tax=Vespula maculifrons TaxID=7453 RepID=A0ABD2ALI6_VESMC